MGSALWFTVAVYAVVGKSVLLALGPSRLASSAAPLVDAVRAGTWEWAVPVDAVGGAAAALGALLALVAVVGRTMLAMARNGDLPHRLAVVHPRLPSAAPCRGRSCDGGQRAGRGRRPGRAIGFSSFGVLLYYLIANLSAFTQPPAQQCFPRLLQVVGAAGCALLVVTLPWTSVVAGLAVLADGIGYRSVSTAPSRTHGLNTPFQVLGRPRRLEAET